MDDEGHPQCYICRKHRGLESVPGGAIYEDDLIFAGHAQIPGDAEAVYLGHLILEPKRHVAGLAGLTDEEAQAIGRMSTRLSRALMDKAGAEHVYAFVLGDKVPHLHVHLVPRYPGAPPEYRGVHVDEWPDAPRGGGREVAALCARLRATLQNDS
jgi:histidine triad (HIT) family protein